MNTIFRLFFSLLLIFSGIIKLINGENFEFLLVENGLFDWSIAPFAIRGIIILEFFLGISFLFKTIHIKLSSVVILLLSSLYLFDFFNHPTDGLYPNHFLLFLFNKWATLGAIIILIFFSTSSLIKSREKTHDNKKRNILLNILFVVIITTPTFIMNPIFIDDIQKNDVSIDTPKLNWEVVFNKCEEAGIDINYEKSTFFAFYSTSCYYCNRSSKMLGISERVSSPKSQIIFVFPGNKEDTETFLKRNKSNFPYIRIPKEDFIKLAGNSYPAFFKVKNKKETHFLTGRTFNYREIDNLFE